MDGSRVSNIVYTPPAYWHDSTDRSRVGMHTPAPDEAEAALTHTQTRLSGFQQAHQGDTSTLVYSPCLCPFHPGSPWTVFTNPSHCVSTVPEPTQKTPGQCPSMPSCSATKVPIHCLPRSHPDYDPLTRAHPTVWAPLAVAYLTDPGPHPESPSNRTSRPTQPPANQRKPQGTIYPGDVPIQGHAFKPRKGSPLT